MQLGLNSLSLFSLFSQKYSIHGQMFKIIAQNINVSEFNENAWFKDKITCLVHEKYTFM